MGTRNRATGKREGMGEQTVGAGLGQPHVQPHFCGYVAQAPDFTEPHSTAVNRKGNRMEALRKRRKSDVMQDKRRDTGDDTEKRKSRESLRKAVSLRATQ